MAWIVFSLVFLASHGAWLTDLPGVHYDEAWFADLAWRIASEPGFWPHEGMNTYTIPFVAYLIAPFFAIFGPSFELARGVLAGIDLIAWVAILAWTRRVFGNRTALGALVIASLLPLVLFQSRIFLEVTTFHIACLASVLWGVLLWYRRKFLAPALVVGGSVIGILSHVLFVSVLVALAYWIWRVHSPLWRELRAKAVTTSIVVPSMTMFVLAGMGLEGSERIKAWALATALGVGLIMVWKEVLRPPSTRLNNRFDLILLLASIPGLFFFLFFEWNGFWPYAQITGRIIPPWISVNFLLGIAVLIQRIRTMSKKSVDSAIFCSFLWLVAMTSFAIFKPTSAKYWALPNILFTILSASLWARHRWALPIARIFVFWNLSYGALAYFIPYLSNGSTQGDFRFFWVRDSARYYRPILRPYRWLASHGCHLNEISLDGNRTDLVFRVQQKFDRVSQAGVRCDLGINQHFYVGAQETSALSGDLLAHEDSWGDLYVFSQLTPHSGRNQP